MIKAILWDNDGVLVDTEHLYFDATREALAVLGVVLTLDLYREISLREGRSCFALARERGIEEFKIERVRIERDARYQARLEEGVSLMEGVAETLSVLHGRLPMAIVTTTDQRSFDTIHRPHDTHRFFEFVLVNGMYERCKPHPDPYLAGAGRIGLQPSECLVIEDSERGLLAAHRAGMKCLVVPNELTRSHDFGHAHRVLSDIRQVPDALETLARGNSDAEPEGASR
jgi:HAD superfamily hydrolase (TIGR01509 family)